MATEVLLHGALPSECNTQQTVSLAATDKATIAQQPTLKALSGAVLGRNGARNSNATTVEKACNKQGSELRSLVASRSVSDPTISRNARPSPRVELMGLIKAIGTLYAFTAAEAAEALQIAFGDPKAALTSFRDVARRRGLNVPADDRVTCSECSRLVRNRCEAAKLGILKDARPDYFPVADMPRHCECFKQRE